MLLAGPRSFCAGVDRAIDTVERALDRYGAPVYVRRQIVHNRHVVAYLEARGAVFVDELDEVPDGATVVFSAHGVAPAVRADAARRDLSVIDATCPLVAKVHHEVRRFTSQGYQVVLVGHADHDEIEGTLGEAPDLQVLEGLNDVEDVAAPDPDKVAYVTQTTLAVDEAADIIEALTQRFPAVVEPTATTSATPPRTARTRSGPSPTTATSCSSSVRATRRTRTAWSRWPAGTAAALPWSTTRRSWTSPPWPTPPRWASPPAPRLLPSWSPAWSTPCGRSVPSRSRSAPSRPNTSPSPCLWRSANAHSPAPERTIGTYLLRQKLAHRDKFPLIVELEPLFACNLACNGCGKIQYPTDILRKRLSVEQAMAAIEESRRADGLDRRRRTAAAPRHRHA